VRHAHGVDLRKRAAERGGESQGRDGRQRASVRPWKPGFP